MIYKPCFAGNCKLKLIFSCKSQDFPGFTIEKMSALWYLTGIEAEDDFFTDSIPEEYGAMSERPVHMLDIRRDFPSPAVRKDRAGSRHVAQRNGGPHAEPSGRRP